METFGDGFVGGELGAVGFGMRGTCRGRQLIGG